MATQQQAPLPGEPASIRRIVILGTGLIGTSVGLALRRAGFAGTIFGWDQKAEALAEARRLGAVEQAPVDPASDDPFIYALAADLVILAGPVFSIGDWLEQLAPVLSASQLVTDVGSVKGFLLERAAEHYNRPGKPGYLPGHPMAGKEQSGAEHAEAALFEGSVWLFTGEPAASAKSGNGHGHGSSMQQHPLAPEWVDWVQRMGARTVQLPAERHDLLCAWISHLPQFASTALSALLEESFRRTFGAEPELHGIGGRALKEMTRLGASPYSMWRDIAHANAPAIAAALLALEQELTHLRENLKTAELRTSFEQANAFRAQSRVSVSGDSGSVLAGRPLSIPIS